MSPEREKSSNIRRIVRIRQMLQLWKNTARMTATSTLPPDVPSGHVAICLGSNCRRFIVRATHLNHPFFKKLLVEAEEEYGFTNQGPLLIPCEESVCEDVLRVVTRSQSERFSSGLEYRRRRCHVDLRTDIGFLNQSRPLFAGFLKSQSINSV